MEDHEIKARAQHAQNLLDDELLNEVLEGMRAKTIRAWENTNLQDADTREELFRMLKAIRELREQLQAIVADAVKLSHVRELEDSGGDVA